MEFRYKVNSILIGGRNYLLRLYPIDKNLDYKPGQFINIVYQNIERSYSIASIPSFPYIELFITKIDGMFTSKLDDIKNQEVLVKGPYGRFLYENQNKVVFVSTGSGITPIISILRHIYSNKIDGEFYLFSSFKYREENIFESELRLYERLGLKLDIRYTKEGDNRISMEELIPYKDIDMYVCGNKEFALSISKEVKPKRLHLEAWG